MGKLIDADKIMDKMENTFDMQELYLPIHFKELIIDDMPSIEAIPKADYEARSKADMVAMLTDIKDEVRYCEITGLWKTNYLEGFNDGVTKCLKAIQQKINALRGEENE